MSGVQIDVKIDDQKVVKLLKQIEKRSGDLKPALKNIGQLVRTSIVNNFIAEGRPEKWKKLSEVRKKQRGKGVKKILRVQGAAGGLMGSIKPKTSAKKVIIGTNKVYAAVHQFGAKKGSFGTVPVNIRAHRRKKKSGGYSQVRAHKRTMILPWGDIPARPYMMIQDEDWTEIENLLLSYLSEE